MSDYQARRDTNLAALYEQTIAATLATDTPTRDLDRLRAILVNQHDARKLLHALPALAGDAFDQLDQMRHAFIAQQFENAAEKAPA